MLIRRNSSELAREKVWARIHLVPLLQAEEDRDQVRRMYAEKQRQKELLGYEPKIYSSDRYAVSMLLVYGFLLIVSSQVYTALCRGCATEVEGGVEVVIL